jgi:hypothetical protein
MNITLPFGLVLAAQLAAGNDDPTTQNAMAPGMHAGCSVMDGSDGTTAFFQQDVNVNGTLASDEKFLFRNGARYHFQIFSGSGTVQCCYTDDHETTTAEPDSLADIGVVDTSSGSATGNELGGCFVLNDNRKSVTEFIERGALRARNFAGIYGGICLPVDTSSIAIGGGSASSDYTRTSNDYRVYKGCKQTTDCSTGGDYDYGIEWEPVGGDQECSFDRLQIRDFLPQTGVLISCNADADVDVVACEVQ